MIRKPMWNEKIGKSDGKQKVGNQHKKLEKVEVKNCENVQMIKIELK